MSQPQQRPEFDRTIVDGPISSAVWKLAWPTMLQNLVAGIQGFVDHAMVGHFVGFQGNAAIGVSWQIFLIVVVFVASLYSGMNVLVARFAGAGDRDKVNRTVGQAFLTSTFLGVCVFAPVGYFAAPWLLTFVNAEASVQAEALPYLRIMFVFSVGMLHFFMLGGALRAAGDARTPLRLGVMMTLLNITLNVILIRGLGPIPAFGTPGAAMGTVISGGLVSAYAMYLLFSGRLVVQLRTIDLKPNRRIITELFRFGLPTGFQGIAMNIGGVILLRFVGSLEQSSEAQAAYAVSYMQLFSLVSHSAIALMSSAAAVAGQNLGAERPDRTAITPRAAAAVGLRVAVPLGLLYLFVPRLLLGLFGLEDPVVLGLGQQFLAFLSVSAVLLTVALSYTGALQGTGDTKSPMWITIFSQLILPLAWCASFQAFRGLRPTDIWLAILLGHFARSSLSVLRFRAGKWRGIEVDIGD